MTDRDPAVQREMDRAAHELARRLEPWAAGMQDPAAFARDYLEWLHGQGLRLIPRPHPALAPHAPGALPNADYRTAADQIRTRTTPPAPHDPQETP